MTVTEICKWLESSNFNEGDRLPSVRSAAESFDASTCTVFRAYRKLAAEGKIYGEYGNGFFWGAKKAPAADMPVREHVTERLERLLLEDWKSGRISADAPLPR